MAPDAPLWQIALVSAGSGLVAVIFRELGNKIAPIKVATNFVMYTILLWMILMTVDLFIAIVRGTLSSSPDRPMWSLLGAAGVLTLIGQFLSARRRSKRNSAAIIEQKLPAREHLPTPKSQAALPYGQRRRLARR
jgi:hypothetical protein